MVPGTPGMPKSPPDAGCWGTGAPAGCRRSSPASALTSPRVALVPAGARRRPRCPAASRRRNACIHPVRGASLRPAMRRTGRPRAGSSGRTALLPRPPTALRAVSRAAASCAVRRGSTPGPTLGPRGHPGSAVDLRRGAGIAPASSQPEKALPPAAFAGREPREHGPSLAPDPAADAHPVADHRDFGASGSRRRRSRHHRAAPDPASGVVPVVPVTYVSEQARPERLSGSR